MMCSIPLAHHDQLLAVRRPAHPHVIEMRILPRKQLRRVVGIRVELVQLRPAALGAGKGAHDAPAAGVPREIGVDPLHRVPPLKSELRASRVHDADLIDPLSICPLEADPLAVGRDTTSVLLARVRIPIVAPVGPEPPARVPDAAPLVDNELRRFIYTPGILTRVQGAGGS